MTKQDEEERQQLQQKKILDGIRFKKLAKERGKKALEEEEKIKYEEIRKAEEISVAKMKLMQEERLRYYT